MLTTNSTSRVAALALGALAAVALAVTAYRLSAPGSISVIHGMSWHTAIVLAACAGVALAAGALALLGWTAWRTRRPSETPWADIPEDHPAVVSFDAATRGGTAESPWADIPEDHPAVVEFDNCPRNSRENVSNEGPILAAPWEDIPDNHPAVAAFDASIRAERRVLGLVQRSAEPDTTTWTDIPDDLPLVARFDASMLRERLDARQNLIGEFKRLRQAVTDVIQALHETLDQAEHDGFSLAGNAPSSSTEGLDNVVAAAGGLVDIVDIVDDLTQASNEISKRVRRLSDTPHIQ